jgi:pyrroline-5-carboxylate reductase
MATQSIGFVGGGRVATIIMGGWTHARRMPAKVVVSDANADVLGKLKGRFAQVETVGDNLAAAAGQEVVFLAVHPPVVKDVLPQIKSALKPERVLVSLAPKLTIAKLSEMLGGFRRIVRMIPNAPSIVGRGYNPVAFGPGVSPEQKRLMLDLLAPLGDCPEVPEPQLEAYAIVTGMGPTYFWPQLYELQSLAESFGLHPEAAREGIARMLAGALATMSESGLGSEEVKDLIPVKPLAGDVDALVKAYREKLTALMEKIRP